MPGYGPQTTRPYVVLRRRRLERPVMCPNRRGGAFDVTYLALNRNSRCSMAMDFRMVPYPPNGPASTAHPRPISLTEMPQGSVCSAAARGVPSPATPADRARIESPIARLTSGISAIPTTSISGCAGLASPPTSLRVTTLGLSPGRIGCADDASSGVHCSGVHCRGAPRRGASNHAGCRSLSGPGGGP